LTIAANESHYLISLNHDEMEELTLDSFIRTTSGSKGFKLTILAPSFISRNMYVSSILREEGKTSLLTNCIVSLSIRCQTVTYDDVSLLESLGDIFCCPEVTFMRFDIGIAIQAPHCPSFFGFLELQTSTVGGNW